MTMTEAKDTFRRQLPFPPPAIPGRTVMTAALAHLPPEILRRVFAAVRAFDAFTPANDPYREHDLGILEVDGERILFKFDYFADATCTEGAEAPAVCCYRVLTIMLARDY